jgi:hypothetical protein
MRHTIFVPLFLDHAALRETEAVPVGDGRFRLVGSPPKHERLLYKKGEIVECDIRTLPGGSKGLVAVRSVSADPEFQKTQTVFIVFGALVGLVLGVIIAVWIDTSLVSASIGAVLGATIFAFCSKRWGDAAWDILGKIIRWVTLGKSTRGM